MANKGFRDKLKVIIAEEIKDKGASGNTIVDLIAELELCKLVVFQAFIQD